MTPLEPTGEDLHVLPRTAAHYVMRVLRELPGVPVSDSSGAAALLADPEIRRRPPPPRIS